MRVEQPVGNKGSLKWIQRAVNEGWPSLNQPILEAIRGREIQWLSPLQRDGFAEYRDDAFLRLLEIPELESDLAEFWPRRGPQWDALAKVDGNRVILVEAKSHVREFCTPASSAGPKSLVLIDARLRGVALEMGASGKADWTCAFYQFANRLAHLWFLRKRGVDAYLALVGFVGDVDMDGPKAADVWDAAYLIATYALGLPTKHSLSRYILHVSPQVPHE